MLSSSTVRIAERHLLQAMAQRNLQYGPACPAVHLKLTDSMWQAIQKAHGIATGMTMNLGSKNVGLLVSI